MGRFTLLIAAFGLCSAVDKTYYLAITTDGESGPVTNVQAVEGGVFSTNPTVCPKTALNGATTPTTNPDLVDGTQKCTNGLSVNLGGEGNPLLIGTTDGNYKNFPDGKTVGPGLAGPVVRVEKMTDGYTLEIEKARTKQCQSWINTPTVNLWGTGTKAILYLLALMWVFLGVAIVADVFMSSIEVITSEEVAVTITDENGNPKEVKVMRWNDTVANLTLMALGSSAPEILLAVLETLGTLGQTPGELGPSTIVGSAAYNLFVITGVCMISVPAEDASTGESGVRDISELGVFYVTGFFSVFAYIWMLICLGDSLVTIPEAILTFLFFPVLVGLAYAQDVGALGMFSKQNRDTSDEEDATQMQKVGSEEEKNLGRALVPKIVGTKNIKAFNEDIKASLTEEEIATMKLQDEADGENREAFIQAKANKVAAKMALGPNGQNKKKSKMFWRVQAGKNAKGKPSVFDQLTQDKAGGPGMTTSKLVGAGAYKGARSTKVYEFNSSHYSVKEDAGHITLHIHKNGDLSTPSEVIYRTLDGTAKAGSETEGDYEATKGVLKFGVGERTQALMINIFHDKKVEDNEMFYIELATDSGGEAVDKAEITIIDVSSVGTFQMRHVEKRCNEACGVCKIWVERMGGSDGTCDVMYNTEIVELGPDNTEMSPAVEVDEKTGDGDYVPVPKGVIRFQPGESIRAIEITIKDNSIVDGSHRAFMVVLNEAVLSDSEQVDNKNENPPVNGDQDRCLVMIQDDDDYSQFVSLVQLKLEERLQKFSLATASYQDQFLDAVEVDRDHTTCISYLLHCVSLPWKVIMAFIPPTDYCGGWLCFGISLAATGIITAIVAELAGMFGCMIGISDAAVALTVVALGTSLPDTFASQLAIMYATDADAAVGNVTGSNSVNVFLGLGLPWCIATFYAASNPDMYPNGYVVPTGSLSLSVAVFAPLAILTLLSLLFNRMMIGGVVGGSSTYRWVGFSIYVSMWILFLVTAISKPFEL